jgi:hypothetical protein
MNSPNFCVERTGTSRLGQWHIECLRRLVPAADAGRAARYERKKQIRPRYLRRPLWGFYHLRSHESEATGSGAFCREHHLVLLR